MKGWQRRVESGALTCCPGALFLPTSSPLFLDAVAVAPAASAGGASVAEAIVAGSAGLAEAGRVLSRAGPARLAVTRTCRFQVDGFGIGIGSSGFGVG